MSIHSKGSGAIPANCDIVDARVIVDGNDKAFGLCSSSDPKSNILPDLLNANAAAVAAAAGLLTPTARPANSGFSKWNIAKGRVRSKTGRAKVLVLTHSYGIGSFNSRFWKSLGDALAANGLPVNFAFSGTKNTAAWYNDDPRYNSVSGFSTTRNQNVFRGSMQSNASGSTIVVTPGAAFDSLDVYHNGFSNAGAAGAYNYKVDAGAASANTQVYNAGGEACIKTSFTGLAGSATSTLTLTSATGSSSGNTTIIDSFLPFNSAVPGVDIFTSSQAGIRLSDHLGTSAPYQAAPFGCALYNALATYQFDLVISMFEINESIAANITTEVTNGVYAGCLASLWARQQAYGSLMIVRPPIPAISGISKANQDAVAAIEATFCTSSGVPYLDYSQRFGTYEAATAIYTGTSLYSDDRHFSDAGHGDIGAVIGSQLV